MRAGGSLLRIVLAVSVILAIGWLVFERMQDERPDPAELTREAERLAGEPDVSVASRDLPGETPEEREAVATVRSHTATLREQRRLAILVHRCREAVTADIRPNKVIRFDRGREPEGAAFFMAPRGGDGLPVIEFDRSMPDRVSYPEYSPAALPARAKVGVRGYVDYTHWLFDGSSSRDYFCEVDATDQAFDVRRVSVFIQR